MKNISKFISILFIAALFFSACEGGSGSDEGGGEADIYEYVTGWTLPDQGSSLELACSNSYLFVCMYMIGENDHLYWYTSDGEYQRDVYDVMVDNGDDIPEVSGGIAFTSGNVLAVDSTQSGELFRVTPANTPTITSIIDYGSSYYVYDIAVSGLDIYTTRATTDFDEWVIDRRNSGDGSADASYTLDDSSDLQAIDVDASGNVYVADREQDKIYKFDSDLNLTDTWENITSSSLSLWEMAAGDDGTVFAIDMNGYKVKVYDTDGNYIGKFGSQGTGSGKFGSIVGITVDSNGYVYVADSHYDDSYNCTETRIQKFKAKS